MTQNFDLHFIAISHTSSLLHAHYYAIKLLIYYLYLYNPMVRGPWVYLYSWHYITKLRVENPMIHLQATCSVPTNCVVPSSRLQLLIKIWALSPKTSLGGSHTQYDPKKIIMTHPWVTLSVRRSLSEDLPILPRSLQDWHHSKLLSTALVGHVVQRPL